MKIVSSERSDAAAELEPVLGSKKLGGSAPKPNADQFSVQALGRPRKGALAIDKLQLAELGPYVAEVAKDQWQYYADHVNADTHHLPPDNIRVEAGRPTVVDARTSPTNIGLYMLSTITAAEMGLIDRPEALRRLRATVQTLEKLPKHVGTFKDDAGQEHAIEHLYNWYGIQGPPAEIGGGFISTVDNGNFVAFLIAVITALGDSDPALSAKLRGMVEKMRFDVLYDKKAGLLYHGANSKDGQLNPTAGHYNMIISEVRTAYAAAIMLDQIPKTAWTNMKRKLGKEIDNLHVNRALDFQSYTGTMFEYLTPRLLMKHAGTPLGVADEQAVAIQKADLAGGIWGRSEANSNTAKGYAAWGSRALSHSKEFTGTGADIIAPYASQMAMGIAPLEVGKNMRRMEALGLRGRYGFYESAAVTKRGRETQVEITPQFYAHHIGMGFLGMANHLHGDVITDWFHGSEFNGKQTLEGLLNTPASQYANPATKRTGQLSNAYAYESPVTYDKTAIIGNARFVSYVEPIGASTWFNESYALTHNESLYLRNNKTGQVLPIGMSAPDTVTSKDGVRSFQYSVPMPEGGTLGLNVEVSAASEDSVKLTRVRIDNRTDRAQDLSITGSLDWILDDINAYLNHPVYRNLYVETSFDKASGTIVARRRTAQGAEQERQPFGFFAVGGIGGAKVDWAGGSRAGFLGRLGSQASPRAVVDPRAKSEFGVTLDPAAVLSKSVQIQAGQKGEVSFLFGFAEREADIKAIVRRVRRDPSKAKRKVGAPHYPPDTSHAKMLELAKRTRRELRIKPTAIKSVDLPPAQMGHWSDNGRVYTVDDPFALKKPWAMVASNGAIGFVATAGGWAYTFGDNSQQDRITPYVPDNTSELPLRGVVVKDKLSGESFSIAPNPAPAGNGKYSVEMSPGQIKYLFRRDDGLALSLSMSLASKDPVELWSIEVDNQSQKPADLELASFLKWAGEQTEARQEAGAVFASNPDAIHKGSVAFHALIDEGGRRGQAKDLMGAPDDPFSGLASDLKVGVGQKKSLAFVLGQAGDQATASALVEKYSSMGAVKKTLATRSDEVSQTLDGLQVKTPDAGLNAMLNTWLPYQAYHAHFVARSGYYQSGGAYGFRDQLQTAMNLLDTGSAMYRDVAKKHIIEASRHQFEMGAVQHWWHPHNNLGQQSTISDNLLWLPHALEHYLEVTGDTGILGEQAAFSVPSRPLKEGELDFVETMSFSDKTASIYEHAKRAIDLVVGERMGEHGLPLIGKGDWNDGLDRVGHLGKGESVWLAFFLYDVLSKFAGVADKHGDLPTAERYRAEAKELKDNIKAHAWDGDHFLRAYTDDGEKIDFNDAIVQAWAVLSGGADEDQAKEAVRSAVASLYKPDDKTILLFDRPLDKEKWGGSLAAYPNGLRENNAQYTHGSSWLPRAVAELGDGDLAMELYKSMLPNEHASDPRYGAEPYVVAADIYGGSKAGEGGWTWYSGGPAWIYRTGIEKILGLKFRDGDRLLLDPTIPKAWPGYEIEHKQGKSLYRIEVTNPEHVSKGVRSVTLDGQPIDASAGIPLTDDGRVHRVKVLLGAPVEAER